MTLTVRPGNDEVIMHIIVASSNVFYRELSSFILSEAGYAVHECHDAEAILRCITQFEPDMVLLDARLAETSSSEVMGCLRQHTGVPIMLIISAASKGTLQALAAWGDDQVAWPYQPEDLLDHVQALLHRPSHIPFATV